LAGGTMSAADIGKMNLLDKVDYKDVLNNKAAMQRTAFASGAEDRRITNQRFTQEKALRTQLESDPFIRNAVEADAKLTTIDQILDRNTGPADEALGMTWQKSLDPISVVRESEFARTAEGQSLLGRLEATWGKAANGTRFTPELRAEMRDIMGRFRDGNAKVVDGKIRAVESNIAGYGLTRENVIAPHLEGLRSPRGAPKAPGAFPRTVRKGTQSATVNSQAELDEAAKEGFQ
jgi:hypothetical protein